MYPASIQLSNDCFHKKTYRQEYIAEDFNANSIAVRGSPRVCGDPVMTRSLTRRDPATAIVFQLKFSVMSSSL